MSLGSQLDDFMILAMVVPGLGLSCSVPDESVIADSISMFINEYEQRYLRSVVILQHESLCFLCGRLAVIIRDYVICYV